MRRHLGTPTKPGSGPKEVDREDLGGTLVKVPSDEVEAVGQPPGVSAGGQARGAEESCAPGPRAEAKRAPRQILVELAKPLSTQQVKGPGGNQGAKHVAGRGFLQERGQGCSNGVKDLSSPWSYALPS